MNEINQIIKKIKRLSESKKLMLSSVESCTGGLISKLLTDFPGSSSFFDSAIISYSNNSKIRLLNVSPNTLSEFGAVSDRVVKEMAENMIKLSSCSVAIAVSGLAKDQTEGINFGIKSTAAESFLIANNIKPKKSIYSRQLNNDKLLNILEKGTVYTYCD